MRKTHFLPGPFGGYISIVALLNKFGKYNSLIFLGIFGLCFLVWRYLFGFPLDVLYGNYDLYGQLSLSLSFFTVNYFFWQKMNFKLHLRGIKLFFWLV